MNWRDRTFCHSDCVRVTCQRYFDDLKHKADQYREGRIIPVAMCDLSRQCPDYTPPRDAA